MSLTYQFTAKAWKDPVASGWYFVRLDNRLSEKIKKRAASSPRPSLLKARATVGRTSWNTTLFLTKAGHYAFVLKADVRKKEHIRDKDTIAVKLSLR
jgi:hypothetical protein